MAETFPASSGEAQAAGFGAAAGVAVNIGCETFGNDHSRQVVHLVAGPADEVNMGFGVCIEPFHAVDCAYADDQTLLLEECKIPVDRSQRDVRVFGLQLGVYPFRCGVAGCGSETIQNRLTFFEVF